MVPRFVMFCRGILLSIVGLTASAWGADPPPARVTCPLRQLELVTGETLIVEFLGLDERSLDFRWHGLTRCRLPLAAVRSIANPPGIIDCWDESFEEMPTVDGVWSSRRDPPWQRTVETPLAAGELTLWYRTRESKPQTGTVHLRCQFQHGGETRELSLRIHDDGAVKCEAPSTWTRLFSQGLVAPKGWVRLSLQWRAGRCEVIINKAVHSVFGMDDAGFIGLALDPVGDEPSAIEIDNVVLRQFDDEVAARPFVRQVSDDQDAVTLATGDQLFGHFRDSSRNHSIALQGPQGDWVGSWNEIQRLDFAPRSLPPNFYRPVDGWCCDIQFTQQPQAMGMTENLRGVRFADRTMWHPWLGAMAWSRSQPATITPHGRGEFRWLEPGRHHLGDEIRPDLLPSRPSGTTLSGSVQFDERPAGSTWIVVDVAELEPSGPHTLPTQPFLETLRGGGLRTELLINDHVVTDLNRFLARRSPVSQPERLWLPVPADAWRAGKNTWTIRQRPLSTTQYQYDDGDIGRIGLWIGK